MLYEYVSASFLSGQKVSISMVLSLRSTLRSPLFTYLGVLTTDDDNDANNQRKNSLMLSCHST